MKLSLTQTQIEKAEFLLCFNVGASILRIEDRVRSKVRTELYHKPIILENYDIDYVWSFIGNDLYDAYIVGCKLLNIELRTGILKK